MPIHTKWPRLLVAGRSVTEQQANDILIRTNNWWWLDCNDHAWNRQVQDLAVEFGWPRKADHGIDRGVPRVSDMQSWLDRHHVLNLEYLSNEQIMSSWIGGAHGWCDWSGTIGCTTYNIGKWPSDDEVTDEWQTIAAAFPYLDLVAQCVDDEGAGTLAAEWRVRDGRVEYNPDPTTLITEVTEPDIAGWVRGLHDGTRTERGVTIGRLREALSQVTV